MTDTSTEGYAVAVLQRLLNSERELRHQAEDLRQESRAALVKLGQAIAAELLDKMAKQSATKIQETSTQGLADMIEADVTARFRRLHQRVRRLQRQLDKQQAKITHLEAELTEQGDSGSSAASRQQKQQSQADAASSLTPPPPPPTFIPEAAAYEASEQPKAGIVSTTPASDDFRPYAEPKLWPNWFREWAEPGLTDARRKSSFLITRTIIRVMGETGEPLRSTILAKAAAKAGHSAAGGAEGRAMTHLADIGVIGKKIAKRGAISPHLVYLTEKGQTAYRLLYGQDPAQQQTHQLLKMHSSPEHTYLILEAQQLLEIAGFHVERYFNPICLPEGEYVPDLIATYKDTAIYLEAERNTYKEPQDREKKWGKAVKASNGQLYLAIGTQREVDPILSELVYVVGKIGHPTNIHAMVTQPLATSNEESPYAWDIFSIHKKVH
jgi:hypothetical protein